MSTLDPTDEEIIEVLEGLGSEMLLLEARGIARALAPYIARKRRDATVAWLVEEASRYDKAWNSSGEGGKALRGAAMRIAKDEDLGDGT